MTRFGKYAGGGNASQRFADQAQRSLDASGWQGHSPCTHRIRNSADAGRFAR
jgi:hypothetical protein